MREAAAAQEAELAERRAEQEEQASGELRQQLGVAAEASAAALEAAAAEHAAYRAEAEAELAMVREERDELSRQAEAMAVRYLATTPVQPEAMASPIVTCLPPPTTYPY